MASRNKKEKQNAQEANYELTEQERVVLQKLAPKVTARSARIKITSDGGVPKVTADHPDERVGLALCMEALATADLDFMSSLTTRECGFAGWQNQRKGS